MNRRTLNVLVLLASASLLVAVAFCSRAGGQAPQPQKPPASVAAPLAMPAELREQIMRALPLGAQIARVPRVYGGPGFEPQTYDEAAARGDTDGDGQEEIVVGYIAPPDFDDVPGPGFGALARAVFFHAHLRVLKQVDGVWREQWDSGGWGSSFQTDRPNVIGPLPAAEQEQYTRNFFSVRDVTGDGRPEILCVQRAHAAAGSLLWVWQWQRSTYVLVARTDSLVTIADGKITNVFPEKDKGQGVATLVWSERTHEFEDERYVQQDADG